MTPIAQVALSLIDVYRRYASPHKGFVCAYGAIHGGSSCSLFADRAIRRLGLFAAIALINRRLDRCVQAFERIAVRRLSENDLKEMAHAKDDNREKKSTSNCDAPFPFYGGDCGGACAAIELASACA